MMTDQGNGYMSPSCADRKMDKMLLSVTRKDGETVVDCDGTPAEFGAALYGVFMLLEKRGFDFADVVQIAAMVFGEGATTDGEEDQPTP